MTRDLLQEAYSAMRHDLRKTILTMLGMAWGIATVVLLLAYGNGFGQAIQNIFESFGGHSVGIYPGRTSQQAGGNKAGVAVRFTDVDVDLIRNVAPLVRHLSRQISEPVTAQSGPRTFSFTAQGVDPSFREISNLQLEVGRFLSDQDNLEHANFAVLGSEAKEKLFSGMPAVGESIRLNGVSFQVIGVLQPRMQEGDNNINRIVYVPYNSMNVLRETHYVGGIWLDFQGVDHTVLTRTIREALAAAHRFRPDDQRAVVMYDMQRQLDQFSIVILGLKVLLGFIGTLTLGIGGVGLANIMLVSVAQRTREIGMEKALGARKRDVLVQFLAEAMVITAAGGVLGLLLSYAVSFFVGRLTLYSAIAKHAEAGDIRLVVAPGILLVATGILAFVGVLSGLFPALRAANLDPIEALRYE